MDVATLGIRVDANGAITALDRFGTEAERTGKRTASLERGMRTLRTAMGALGVGFGISQAIRKFVDETSEAERVQAQLGAVLKSTGNAAGQTIGQLNAMANSLQETTAFSDEAVGSAQALLLTFTRIRGAEFTGATQAVLDMAQAMGGDLQGAALQVGKALNDPVQGVTALQRAGVQLTESQKEVIKQLVETGHQAEAQRIILKELETEFGGSAAAARDTFGGALKHLQNVWGNLFEASDSASKGIVDAINRIADALPEIGRKAAESFGSTIDWLRKTELRMNAVATQANVAGLALNYAFTRDPAVLAQLAAEQVKLKEIGDEFQRIERHARGVKNALDDPLAERRELAGLIPGSPGGGGSGGGGDTSGAADGAKRIASMRLEVEKARALNDAHRESELELGKLTIEYDRLKTAQELSQELHGKQLETALALNNALAAEKIKTLELADAEKVLADQLKLVADMRAKAQANSANVGQNLKGALGDGPGLGSRAAQKDAADAANADEHYRVWKEANDKIKKDALEKEQKYLKDMKNIWSDGLSKIITDGAKSFNDLFEDILQMFSKLMRRMEEEGKTAGFAYGALRVGSAGIAGGIAGYQIGHSSGSYTRGAIGGAVGGAATGYAIAGPIGAVVGGLTGLVSGLFGAKKAAEEAAAKLRQLKAAYVESIAAFEARAAGMAESFNNKIRAIEKDAADQRKLAIAANPGQITNGAPTPGSNLEAEYKRIAALQDEYLKRLLEEYRIKNEQFAEDLKVRLLTAQGKDKEAEALALTIKQQRELAEFDEQVRLGLADAGTRALLLQVQAAEKVKKATDELLKSSVNLVQGYKYQGTIFKNLLPKTGGTTIPDSPTFDPNLPFPDQPWGTPTFDPSLPSPSFDLSGDLSVSVVLQDGSVLGNVVLKDFKKRAAKQYGDSTAWSQIQ